MRRQFFLVGLLCFAGAGRVLSQEEDGVRQVVAQDAITDAAPEVVQQEEVEEVAHPEDANDDPAPQEPAEVEEEAPQEPSAASTLEPQPAEVPPESEVAMLPEPVAQSAPEIEESDEMSEPKPKNDEGCRWSWVLRRCVPRQHCRYQYQFLDATPGESCRLTERPNRKHPLTGGKLRKTANVLAGATALVAADVAVVAFTPALKRFPLITNIIQGFVLFAAGDAYFQVLEQGVKAKKMGLRVVRAIKSGLIGALNNGLVHYSYYRFIDEHFPYHRFQGPRWGPEGGLRQRLGVAWAKYWLEWPTIGAYKIASMYTLTALLNRNLSGLAEKFRKRFWLTMLRSLQVWPLYDTILYAFVPTAHRPLFNAFMSIAWGGYLSHVSQPEEAEGAEGAAAATAGGGAELEEMHTDSGISPHGEL